MRRDGCLSPIEPIRKAINAAVPGLADGRTPFPRLLRPTTGMTNEGVDVTVGARAKGP